VAVKVRGICKCGRVVNTEATLDRYGRQRATWRGPCPRKGCDGVITARRVRDDAPPPADDKTNEPKPKKQRRKVTKVSYGNAPHDQPAPVQRVPGAADEPAAGPAAAGGREPADRPTDAAGAGDQPGPPAEQPRRRPARAAHPESGRRRAPYEFLGW
jgi:hypothetical protein